MSIESRLAAKKRSQKARRNAKFKSALELGVIILIPVLILVVVLLVWYNSLPRYSRMLDKEGNIKRYNIKEYVTVADLDAIPITYDKYKPTDLEVEKKMVANLKSQIEAKEKTDAQKTDGTDTENKDDASQGNTSSGNSTVDTTGAVPDETKSGDGEKELTEEEKKQKEEEEKKKKEEEEAAERAKYLAMFTDENVELYFSATLGDKYPHTAEGYRTYVTETMQHDNFHSKAANDLVSFIRNTTSIKKLPSNRFFKNWTKIKIQEMNDSYEYAKANEALYQALYGAPVGTKFEYYGVSSQKEFEAEAKSRAEQSVKDMVCMLAAFDKLGLTYDENAVKEYVVKEYTTFASYDEAVEEYGAEFLALDWKYGKVVDTLLERIHSDEDENDKTEDKTEEMKDDKKS